MQVYKRYCIKILKTFAQAMLVGLLVSSCNSGSASSNNTNESSVKASLRPLLSISEDDMDKMDNMLIDNRSHAGFTYNATAPNLGGFSLPLSFYAPGKYFSNYVCKIPGNDCQITDVYNPEDGSIVPQSGNQNSIALQYERTSLVNATDIYDAATWQIAVSLLGGVGISGSQDKLLAFGYDGQASESQAIYGANRATSNQLSYGSIPGSQMPLFSAYYFKAVPTNFIVMDPLEAESPDAIKTSGFPPSYKPGDLTWFEWQSITGEIAWAFLIGPLQSAYMVHKDDPYPSDYNSTAVQNAIHILPSIGLLQTNIGAVYYAPAGTASNAGVVVSPYTVSVENNTSTLAGLMILWNILKNIEQANPGTVNQQVMVNLHSMIFGGPTDFFGKTQQTAGIISFLKNYAFDKNNGIFYQEGHVNDPIYPGVWAPGVDPQGTLKTVDVNTWTLSLLAPLVDQWNLKDKFGHHITSFDIWHNVKKFGGFYGPDNTLWGVGYTEADGNGYSSSPAFNNNGILSGEWTAGAINMVYVLMDLYKDDPARSLILTSDYNTMITGVRNLGTDKYQSESPAFPMMPQNYSSLINLPSNKLGYMYASKRYYIPFGWYANPLPSLCSTSWMVMVGKKFNPFILGGGVPHLSYFE